MTDPVNPYESPAGDSTAYGVAPSLKDDRDLLFADWICIISTVAHVSLAGLVVAGAFWASAPILPSPNDLLCVAIAASLLGALGWSAWQKKWFVIEGEAALFGGIAFCFALVIGLRVAFEIRDGTSLINVFFLFLIAAASVFIAGFCSLVARLASRMRRRGQQTIA